MNRPAVPNDDSLPPMLRSAVDCVADGVLITDAQLEAPGPFIVYANRGFEKMTGYAAHEILGRSPRILHGPRTERAVWERLAPDLREKGRFVGETFGYRKDGSEFRARWCIQPIAASDGRLTNLLATWRDITVPTHIDSEIDPRLAVSDAEEQARRLNEQLAHIARLNALGELAGRLAHELNQPLTAIANYAQGCSNRLQAGRIEGGELIGVLDLISNAALRAGAIVDRLRSFVRRKGPQRVAVDLPALIRRQLEMIEPDVRESRVQIVLDLPADLPRVRADLLQLEQVVVNLVRNALEAMSETPAEDRRLAIRARQTEANEIEVSFYDRGRGVHGEVAERLFEPFFSTKTFGLGMGLPVSRSILQWHGGRLWWEANADGGACFRFTLPITQGETSDGDGE